MGGDSGLLGQSGGGPNVPPLESQSSGFPAPAGPPINAQSPALLLSRLMQGGAMKPGAFIGGLPANSVLGGLLPSTSAWDRFQTALQAPVPRAAPVQPMQRQMVLPAPAPPKTTTRKEDISYAQKDWRRRGDESE